MESLGPSKLPRLKCAVVWLKVSEQRNIKLESFLFKGWRPLQLGWRPSLLSWRPSFLGWRPFLLGWRPSLVRCCGASVSRFLDQSDHEQDAAEEIEGDRICLVDVDEGVDA